MTGVWTGVAAVTDDAKAFALRCYANANGNVDNDFR